MTLPENVVGKDFRLFHVHEEDGNAASVEEIIDFNLKSTTVSNGSELATGFSFTTGDFSYFVLSYTVDFEYTDENGNVKSWSFWGQDSYPISEILENIGVSGTVEKVELELIKAVETTDERALYLEEKEDGWYLTSDVAFDDTYELTITLDEKTIIIIVTDATPTPVPFVVSLSFNNTPVAVNETDNLYVLLDASIQAGGETKHAKKAVKIITDGASVLTDEELQARNTYPILNADSWYTNNNQCYVWFDASSMWYYDNSNYYVYLNNKWYSADGVKSWSEYWEPSPIAENWSVSATIIKPKNGTDDLTDPGNYMQSSKYETVSTLKGTYEYKSGTELADHQGYSINLEKLEFEDAISPYSLMGDAMEFGIVANKLKQKNDTETNFAVNIFDTDGQSFHIEGSGSGDIPIYVGEVDTDKMHIANGNCTIDLYTTQDVLDHYLLVDAGLSLNRIPQTKPQINQYVNTLIGKVESMSSQLAGKTTVKPGNVDKLDFTEFPDDVTIYVDCEEFQYAMVQDFTIIKRPGQSIVFNIPGTDNKPYDGETDIKLSGFHVTVVWDDETPTTIDCGAIKKTDDPSDKKSGANIILKHIFFNVINATNVDMYGTASGVFLLPKATYVKNNTGGAGWIMVGTATGMIDSVNEWHFFYKERYYHSQGSATLQLQKVVKKVLGNGPEVVPFNDVKKSFSFTLTQANSDWEETNTVYHASTDSSGHIIFSGAPFSFSTNEQNNRQIRNFIITEDHPDGTTQIKDDTYFYINGVAYTGQALKIQVEAQDEPISQSNGTIHCKMYLMEESEESGELSRKEEISPTNSIFVCDESFVNLIPTGEATIEGKKEFSSLLTDEQIALTDEQIAQIQNYDFSLSAVTENAPMPANTTPVKLVGTYPDLSFRFGPIQYSYSDLAQHDEQPASAEFVYQISETGSVSGITNDTHTHYAKVTVTENKSTGTLDTNITYYISTSDSGDGVDINLNDSESFKMVEAAEFTFNNAIPVDGFFEFEKRWTVLGSYNVEDWPEGVTSITVTLKRTAVGIGGTAAGGGAPKDQSVSYSVKKDGITIIQSNDAAFHSNPKKVPEDATKPYAYRISELETTWTNGAHKGEWKYTLSEVPVSGYLTHYFKPSGVEENSGVTEIISGGRIDNQLVTYELPETGGSGTAVYGLIGGLMLVTAGAVLTLRKKKNKV